MSSSGEVVDLGDARRQLQRRQRPRRPGQLQPGLLEVVGVQVRVAQGVHELAGPQADHLGHHLGQQGVGGDVERHAEEHVGRPLVQLAGQRAVGDVELEHGVARRQRHLGHLGDVPGRDDVPAGVRVGPQRLHDRGDLVDVPAVRGRPGPPLVPVDRPEFALGVGPLVPDADPALLQPADVGRALQEPQQLHHHRPDVHLLGGDQRESGGQIEPHLVAEDAAGAGAGAVGLDRPGGQDAVHQVQVLLHGTSLGAGRPASRPDTRPRAYHWVHTNHVAAKKVGQTWIRC